MITFSNYRSMVKRPFLSSPSTYDHRAWRIWLPFRSGVLKPHIPRDHPLSEPFTPYTGGAVMGFSLGMSAADVRESITLGPLGERVLGALAIKSRQPGVPRIDCFRYTITYTE